MRLAIVFLTISLAALAQNIHQYLWTGQSLCAGTGGIPALTTTQPYSNVHTTGVNPWTTPLFESTWETERSAAANQATSLIGSYLVNVPIVGCTGGASYATLAKGTSQYNSLLNNTTISNTHKGANTLTVHSVNVTHGEQDTKTGVTKAQYYADLIQWQSDYDADVKAITGQSSTVVMMMDQMHTWTQASIGHTTPTVSLAQWEVARDNPTTHMLVGPKYQYTYYSDGLHMVNTSYRLLGELYGKVWKRVFNDSEAWLPLCPTTILIVGAVITATMHVPTGVLAIDTTIVSDKGNGKGFEYTDDSGSPPAISSVSVSGAVATITLASTPTGSNKRLRYAYTGTLNAGGGTSGAPHGNIRDTETMVGYSSGTTLYDWLITFDEPVLTASPVNKLFPLPDSLIRQ